MPWKDPEARKLYDREWARKNKEKRQAINAKWQQANMDWLQDLKASLKCNRCPESHVACLQFHHLDPTQKDIAIADAARSWSKERILSEIEKCEVLCANCHAKEHYKG